MACAIMLLYDTSEEAICALLGDGRAYRVEKGHTQSLEPREIRARLARRLSPRSDSLHLVGAFVQFSGTDEPATQVTRSGDGLACSIRRLRGKTGLSLAQVGPESRRVLIENLALRSTDLLLARVDIGERPRLAVIRTPFLDPADFDRESGAIRDRLRAALPGESSPSRWLDLGPARDRRGP